CGSRARPCACSTVGYSTLCFERDGDPEGLAPFDDGAGSAPAGTAATAITPISSAATHTAANRRDETRATRTPRPPAIACPLHTRSDRPEVQSRRPPPPGHSAPIGTTSRPATHNAADRACSHTRSATHAREDKSHTRGSATLVMSWKPADLRSSRSTTKP